MIQKKVRMVCGIFLCTSLLVWCSLEVPSSIRMGGEKAVTLLEEAPVLTYTVPVVRPGVLVSQGGYRKEGKKTVIFQGQELPKEFAVVEAETGKVVYTGHLDSPVYNRTLGEYISYGEFTPLETEGDYYILCDTIGRSYLFTVSDDIYGDILEHSLTVLKEETSVSVQENCRIVAALLLAYELFPEVHEDSAGENTNGIPSILEECAARVEQISGEQNIQTGGVGSATAWYAAVLAKFSHLYQKYDSTTAKKYIQLADKAWKYMEEQKDAIPQERFFAAAELYRATGRQQYHNVAKELGRSLVPEQEREALIYGRITYTATESKVDVGLCSYFLLDLMEQAEEISEESKEATFLVKAEIEEEGLHWFLDQMTIMCVVDYVNANKEYATVIENHQQYLMGRNYNGACYIDGEQSNDSAEVVIWSNPLYTAKYILMLSEILNHK